MAASRASARRLSGPYRELEGRIVALAGVQRRGEERLALPTGSLDPTGQYQRMPVHDDAVLDPKVEMSDPHLLVNERDELLDLRSSLFRDLEFEGASDVQGLDVVHPGEGDLVVRSIFRAPGGMVISSSPARSNDHSLVEATRSTTSRGLPRDCSLKSMRDIPVSTCRFEVEMHALPHAHSPRRLFFCYAVPGGADPSLRGESLASQHNPLIPALKVPLGGLMVNDWWISGQSSTGWCGKGLGMVASGWS